LGLSRIRARLAFRGVVQGVGFRPAIYRLATDMGLAGWVANAPEGALVEIEGDRATVESFALSVSSELPPHASVHSLEITYLDPADLPQFEIRESLQEGQRVAHVPPDIATCADCLAETLDPTNRRYRYPFTNCTNCGPRYSIILRLPYDRPNTTMASFAMCPECLTEYRSPRDRRFHAQPNACPVCGPSVAMWGPDGAVVATDDAAIRQTAEALRRGDVVAVKGLGGFHLVVRADDDCAVSALRARKRREEKPLALMCPTADWVRALCELDGTEERALSAPERPILLLRKRVEPRFGVSDQVAPGNPNLGAMLPYTPLHHLLLGDLGMPVVATSGNMSDEPICTEEDDALTRLGGIADWFLVHNRPIRRHVDDSIVRVISGREQVLRRARGFAPLPIAVPLDGPTVMAVGAHLKSAVALAIGSGAFVSQHIGDLDMQPARTAHSQVIEDLETLYEVRPEVLARDAHPDYASSLAADSRPAGGLQEPNAGETPALRPVPIHRVQHHYAHILSCMAENEIEPSVLGVAWDGTGFGDDGSIWGGEFLLVGADSFQRVGRIRSFPLPGGDAAMREPRRSALGLMYALHGAAASARLRTDDPEWDARSAPVLLRMAATGVNSPTTTSVGRLFDAVASLVGVRHVSRFEGQAAMELEWLIRNDAPPCAYNLEVGADNGTLVLDWGPMTERILADTSSGAPLPAIARGFHDALIAAIVAVADRVGVPRLALSGGCFQNRYLAEGATSRLTEAGFRVYTHQRVPPNDGGIALGQVVSARRACSRSFSLRST